MKGSQYVRDVVLCLVDLVLACSLEQDVIRPPAYVGQSEAQRHGQVDDQKDPGKALAFVEKADRLALKPEQFAHIVAEQLDIVREYETILPKAHAASFPSFCSALLRPGIVF